MLAFLGRRQGRCGIENSCKLAGEVTPLEASQELGAAVSSVAPELVDVVDRSLEDAGKAPAVTGRSE